MKLLTSVLLLVFAGILTVRASNVHDQTYSTKLTYNFTTSGDRKGLVLQLPAVKASSLPIPQDGNGKLIPTSKEAIKAEKETHKRRNNLLYLIILPGVLILASTCMLLRAKFVARKKGISLPSFSQMFKRNPRQSGATPAPPQPSKTSYLTRKAGDFEFWLIKKVGKKKTTNCRRAPVLYMIGKNYGVYNDKVTDPNYRCGDDNCRFCPSASNSSSS